MPDHTAIQLATAVARRDEPQLLLLLDPGVAFRGMTPDRFTEVRGPAAVVEVLFTHWLTPADQVTDQERRHRHRGRPAPGGLPALRRQPRRLVRRGAPGLLPARCRPRRLAADDELGPAPPPDLTGTSPGAATGRPHPVARRDPVEARAPVWLCDPVLTGFSSEAPRIVVPIGAP